MPAFVRPEAQYSLQQERGGQRHELEDLVRGSDEWPQHRLRRRVCHTAALRPGSDVTMHAAESQAAAQGWQGQG